MHLGQLRSNIAQRPIRIGDGDSGNQLPLQRRCIDQIAQPAEMRAALLEVLDEMSKWLTDWARRSRRATTSTSSAASSFSSLATTGLVRDAPDPSS
ncbi:hypothetical protein A6U89_28415 [Agrobacterium sp. B133/95]|nr:hypothetical protein A6U88_29160 [Agrobacterium sp. B131/95]OCJ28539.1 hypothetical protein A6U89_28415 [Agrobacterium sp. B133/95]